MLDTGAGLDLGLAGTEAAIDAGMLASVVGHDTVVVTVIMVIAALTTGLVFVLVQR